jgi:hypothetical protein
MSANPKPEPADPIATKNESDRAQAEGVGRNSLDTEIQTPESPSVGNKPESAPKDGEKKKDSGEDIKVSDEGGPLLSAPERQAHKHALAIVDKIKARRGKFLRDEDGHFYIQMEGKTILLDDAPDNNNIAPDELLMTTRGVPGTASPAGRYAVRWLRMFATRTAKGASILRRFSALSKDERRLYVPVKGALLQVSAGGIKSRIKSGENVDQIVLEAADGQELFNFVDADPKEGLQLFEELIVSAQAVVDPAMAWLLAMQSVLFRSDIECEALLDSQPCVPMPTHTTMVSWLASQTRVPKSSI